MAKIIQLQRGEGASPVPAIIDDAWTVLRGAEGAALTDEQIVAAAQSTDAVLFPLTAWLAHKDGALAGRAANITGIWLAPEDEPADAQAAFASVAVVAVDFPVFRDGRGFSTAYLLRTRYNWKGELRAIGDVLRDQLNFMKRCGFDTFAVRADKNIDDAIKGFTEFTVAYQASVDEPLPLFRRNRAEALGKETA
ncbi:oxidoreductase [Burkholderiaceae bacterium 16]|nr:oxidoreductase [Burkholderiaceae bacterium 16]